MVLVAAVMRSLSTLKEHVIPMLNDLILKLKAKLAHAAKNPSKPHYNHFLFETMSLAMRTACKNNPASVATFETMLFPLFQDILQQDVQGNCF
jgi:exportin-2 (importin alpha re-exporter)